MISKLNGLFDKDAKGSLLLRELAFMIDTEEDFSTLFSVQDPLNTPKDFTKSAENLAKLAHVAVNLDKAGMSLHSSIADNQFFDATTPQGNSAEQKWFWPGLFEEEGGFNMVAAWTWDNTLQARHYYDAVLGHESEEELYSDLTTEGYHIRFGSSWIMAVDFSKEKVNARGIMTYSQSYDASNDYAYQQACLYSQQAQLHHLPFIQKEITRAQISRLSLSSSDTLARTTIHCEG
ncbi:penicillin acylase family protein [uncultured Methylophaga sp.]|uniref:penicillin acylase family protein n=1 Tax=uncultured Methylophaga sp. TaxID=285271 RepID=UPI00259D2465|nr:penicillin acylase family protein [uncultured Methylophaga sp.]